jgi:dTDP-4-amino-4,6-dideoxygalactose transaminase
LERTDAVMERTFFIGVYPGLTETCLSYMAEALDGLRSRFEGAGA